VALPRALLRADDRVARRLVEADDDRAVRDLDRDERVVALGEERECAESGRSISGLLETSSTALPSKPKPSSNTHASNVTLTAVPSDDVPPVYESEPPFGHAQDSP
jgi:hypothetical protein